MIIGGTAAVCGGDLARLPPDLPARYPLLRR
jgi:hypothetical protein